MTKRKIYVMTLGEVNNTFDETKNYWLTAENSVPSVAAKRYRSTKEMHVSPFHPMDLEYDWILAPHGERPVVHMNTLKDGRANFDATLELNRHPSGREATRKNAMRVSDYDHARNRGDPLAGPPAMAEESSGVYASGKNKEHFRGAKVERGMTWRNFFCQGGFLEVMCPRSHLFILRIQVHNRAPWL